MGGNALSLPVPFDNGNDFDPNDTILPEVRFTSGEFITALCRKMGLPIPLLLSAVGHAYTTVTGAKGDHVRTLHDTILAYLIDSVASAGNPCKGGFGNTCKNLFAH